MSATRSRPDRSWASSSARRARFGRRTGARPPTWRCPNWPARRCCRPVPVRPGSGGWTAWPASAPPRAGRVGRWRRTLGRSAAPPRGCRRRSGPAGGAPVPGGRPGSPGPARCHDGLRSVPGCGGPWARPARPRPRQHGLEHLQAGLHGQGQQPLTGGVGKLGDRDGHPLGQVTQGLVGGGGVVSILRHGGPLLVERLGGCPTPTTRQVSGGDRHLNFYETRDNLRCASGQRFWPGSDFSDGRRKQCQPHGG
jgi:hypothetical protein